MNPPLMTPRRRHQAGHLMLEAVAALAIIAMATAIAAHGLRFGAAAWRESPPQPHALHILRSAIEQANGPISGDAHELWINGESPLSAPQGAYGAHRFVITKPQSAPQLGYEHLPLLSAAAHGLGRKEAAQDLAIIAQGEGPWRFEYYGFAQTGAQTERWRTNWPAAAPPPRLVALRTPNGPLIAQTGGQRAYLCAQAPQSPLCAQRAR